MFGHMENKQILTKTTPNFAMPETPVKSITPVKCIFPPPLFQLCNPLLHTVLVHVSHLVISTVTLLA